MPFPDSPRVRYNKNPLEEVICQVRFPSILLIETQLPAEFQEQVRARFPIFESNVDSLPALDIDKLKKLFGSGLPLQSSKNYKFTTEDSAWVVNLTKEFLALTCKEYTKWEEFKEHLEQPFTALTHVYGPAFFSRIGLRYRNSIRRSMVGMKDEPWSELLEPHILGPLGLEGAMSGAIQTIHHEVTFNIVGGKVCVRHGLYKPPEGGECQYIIDADFFSDTKTEVQHALERLRSFNRDAGRLFRWCIKGRLHDALGPTVL